MHVAVEISVRGDVSHPLAVLGKREHNGIVFLRNRFARIVHKRHRLDLIETNNDGITGSIAAYDAIVCGGDIRYRHSARRRGIARQFKAEVVIELQTGGKQRKIQGCEQVVVSIQPAVLAVADEFSVLVFAGKPRAVAVYNDRSPVFQPAVAVRRRYYRYARQYDNGNNRKHRDGAYDYSYCISRFA